MDVHESMSLMAEALAESGAKRLELMKSSAPVLKAPEKRTPGTPDFQILVVCSLHHSLLSDQMDDASLKTAGFDTNDGKKEEGERALYGHDV